ncbi:MAG: hypothetical protein IRZ28_10195 [Steroidobacteraceae bacterium]|nr:hypothetical protein [Steroidobacteraceae bacterium]
MSRHIAVWAAGLVCLVIAGQAAAEPYLATYAGFKCSQCHVNPTGGGMRNAFGNSWAQTQLAAMRIGPEEELWTGVVNRFLAVGGNARAEGTWTRIPHEHDANAFDVQEARLYLDASIIPSRLSFYVDELVAPGNADNREANMRFWVQEGSLYVKAGRMYLPFGWRLEDDNAFVRQLSGISMQTPDSGVELGLEKANWALQLAVSNGSGGAPENDNGKQVTGRAEYVQSRWRIGASAAFNDSDAGDRTAGALFGGFRLGPTVWLGEVDLVEDDSLDNRDSVAALAEVNWFVRKGHVLKLTHEWLDPDRDVDEDEQTRSSFVYEWWPVQFLETRIGVRLYDGIPQNNVQNRTETFAQLHAYF